MMNETRPKAGNRVSCRTCGKVLVLVARRGLWACDPETRRRHRCCVVRTTPATGYTPR